MTIKNTVSSNFDPCQSIVKSVFDCRISSVIIISFKCESSSFSVICIIRVTNVGAQARLRYEWPTMRYEPESSELVNVFQTSMSKTLYPLLITGSTQETTQDT